MSDPQWIVAVILAAFTGGVLEYARRLGENAATKQDVEEITDKVEGVKAGYTKEIEAVKAALTRTVHVHRVQAELEIKVYKKIWAAIVAMDMSMRDLHARPLLPQPGDPADVHAHAEAAARAALTTYVAAIDRWKPFYHANVFEALDAVGDAARKYVSGRDRAKGRIAGAPDGLDLARNQADVIVWIGHACDAIRSRLAALTLYNEGSTIR